MTYSPTSPAELEFRAWQLEQMGAVRAGLELRWRAAELRAQGVEDEPGRVGSAPR